MKTYHVAKWNELYENNRSRKIEDLRWIPIPNSHDGEKYSELITRQDGMELFAAWILILQVASRCAVRGSLVRSNGHPHDSASLSLKTRAPEKIFAKALPYLEQIGWLTSEVYEQPELALERQSSASETSHERQSIDEEGKGIEGNGREEKGIEIAASSPQGEVVSKIKKRDPLKDALASCDGSDPFQVPPTAWSGIVKCLAEIKAVSPDVTPQEIARRVNNYREHYKDIGPPSPQALAKWWAKCDKRPQQNGSSSHNPENFPKYFEGKA